MRNNFSKAVLFLGIIGFLIIAGIIFLQMSPTESFNAEEMTTKEHPLSAQVKTRLMESEGGELLLQTIEAHGGLDAWHHAETSSYLIGSTGGVQSKMVANNRTRQVYHDIRSMGADAPSSGAQMVWDGTNAWVYPDTLRVNSRFMATTWYYFHSIPFILADPGVRYEILPNEVLEDVEYRLLRATFDDGVGDAPGDHYTLYIHPETHLVDALRYRSTYGSGRPPINDEMTETLLDYMDYVTVNGLTVATKFQGFGFSEGLRGDQYYEVMASEISYRIPFDPSRLTMPSDARIDPGPPE